MNNIWVSTNKIVSSQIKIRGAGMQMKGWPRNVDKTVPLCIFDDTRSGVRRCAVEAGELKVS